MKSTLFSILFTLALILTCLICGSSQVASETWFTNKDKVQLFASNNDSNILMIFAGSDWCRPCIKFKKEILLSEEFSQLDLAILYLDFPAKKKNKLSKEQTSHHEALADKYNRSGSFPKIVLLDSKFATIKSIEYTHQTPEEFINLIQ